MNRKIEESNFLSENTANLNNKRNTSSSISAIPQLHHFLLNWASTNTYSEYLQSIKVEVLLKHNCYGNKNHVNAGIPTKKHPFLNFHPLVNVYSPYKTTMTFHDIPHSQFRYGPQGFWVVVSMGCRTHPFQTPAVAFSFACQKKRMEWRGEWDVAPPSRGDVRTPEIEGSWGELFYITPEISQPIKDISLISLWLKLELCYETLPVKLFTHFVPHLLLVAIPSFNHEIYNKIGTTWRWRASLSSNV